MIDLSLFWNWFKLAEFENQQKLFFELITNSLGHFIVASIGSQCVGIDCCQLEKLETWKIQSWKDFLLSLEVSLISKRLISNFLISNFLIFIELSMGIHTDLKGSWLNEKLVIFKLENSKLNLKEWSGKVRPEVGKSEVRKFVFELENIRNQNFSNFAFTNFIFRTFIRTSRHKWFPTFRFSNCLFELHKFLTNYR